TLNGIASIDNSGALVFQGTQTLSGTATVLLGANGSNRLGIDAVDANSSATLTLGANVLVHGQNGSIGNVVFVGGTSKLVNNGKISADVNGGVISLQTNSSDADSTTNKGTMEAINGGTLAIDSNVSNTAVIQAGNAVGTSHLNLES